MSVSCSNDVTTAAVPRATSALTWLALILASAALAGSLFLSLAMNLKACPLCFYQRTFVMSVVGVLGIGLVFNNTARLSLMALPLATAGLGVALLHTFLEARGTLECPLGVFGLGTAPQQSLAMFAVLFVVLSLDVCRAGCAWGGYLGGLVLGGLLTLASSVANPPMPSPPVSPYPGAPEICRPPFRAPG